ncbi:MAG: hypothetical protein AAGJ94_03855 [Pseudomonadota bacterium]
MTRPPLVAQRERATAALADGATCQQGATWFAISVSAVVKWSQRLRQSDSIVPDKMGAPK